MNDPSVTRGSTMLDLNRLRYFQAVADAGSFSRAARRLGLSQPTLSVQVARLEEEIGALLLQRDRTGVRLTETGRRLLTFSSDLLARIGEMEHALRADVHEPVGDFRIGAIHSFGIYVMPEALLLMRERYPRLTPSLRIDNSENVMDMLAGGEIDLALSAHAKAPDANHSQLLADDPLKLVCGLGHRFWGRQYVRPQDLAGEALVGFEAEAPTTRLINGILDRHSVDMKTLLRTSSIEAQIRMVSLNLAMAFLPAIALRSEGKHVNLHAIDFASDELHRGLWASWSSPAPLPSRDAVIACVQEAVNKKLTSDAK